MHESAVELGRHVIASTSEKTLKSVIMVPEASKEE